MIDVEMTTGQRHDAIAARLRATRCTRPMTMMAWVTQVFFRSDHTYITLKAPLKAMDHKPTPEQTVYLLTEMLRAPDRGIVSCDGAADMRAIERVWTSHQ